MCDWTAFLTDATPIRAIFGDQIPSGRGLVLHEALLCRDGPSVTLRLDFPEFPKNPPSEWVSAGLNQVQVQLTATAIHELSINGLWVNMAVDLSISEEGSKIRIKLTGPTFDAKVLADGIFVVKVSADKVVLP